MAEPHSETPTALLYTVLSTPPLLACPGCGSLHVKRHGRGKPMFVNDTPRAGRPVGLWVRQQRIRCLEPECGRASTLRPPWLHPEFRATIRLVQLVEREAKDLTFSAVARHCGLDERTVREIFSRYAAELDRRRRVRAPRVLGIDETGLKGRAALVLTDIEAGTVLDLYPVRDYDLLALILRRFQLQRRVQVVTMDMHRPYRTAVQAELPDAVIVVDKFHVLRLADFAVDTHRRALQHRASSPRMVTRLKKVRHLLRSRTPRMDVFRWGRMHAVQREWPDLYEVWTVREQLYAVYDATSRQEAERRYDALVADLSPGLRAAFRPLLTAVGNWRAEVFAFFGHPYTNATTEALNGVIKALNRSGRGYSFQILRAKVLDRSPSPRRTSIRPAQSPPVVREPVPPRRRAPRTMLGYFLMKLLDFPLDEER